MRAGTVLGAYRVIQQIGAGGMGSVWIAEHTMLGRRAALKVLHPDMSKRGDIVRRFFNEARAATAIPDPGIVQVFDFGHADDGSAYIVMELLDGEVLDKRIQRAAIDIPQALRLMRQAANTLGAAHARGIVHRDVKPDNIFIIKDPEVVGGERVKILDFGIAKLNDERRTSSFRVDGAAGAASSGVLGTPLFMSPEQCMARSVDARADVYALGCVLFQLLTGRYPYDAEDPDALVKMHLSAPVPLPSTYARAIPRELDAIVARCLAKNPLERYADGKELAAILTELTGSTTDPATRRASSSPILQGLATPPIEPPYDPPSNPGQDPASNPPPPRHSPLPPTLRGVGDAFDDPTLLAPNDPRKITTLSRATGSGATGESRRRSPLWIALAACLAVAVGVAASIVWRGSRESDEVKLPSTSESATNTVTMPAVQPQVPTPVVVPTPPPVVEPAQPATTASGSAAEAADTTTVESTAADTTVVENAATDNTASENKAVGTKTDGAKTGGTKAGGTKAGANKNTGVKIKTKAQTQTQTQTQTQSQTKKLQTPPGKGIKLDENGVPVNR